MERLGFAVGRLPDICQNAIVTCRAAPWHFCFSHKLALSEGASFAFVEVRATPWPKRVRCADHAGVAEMQQPLLVRETSEVSALPHK